MPTADHDTPSMPPGGSLGDVAGLRVGHHTETRRPTGCTVVLALDGAVAGVDVRGAAPGTRETELLSPLNTVPQVHALVLAGGSAFGLDAAGGVMQWLAERGIGVPVGPARVPIVPSAILFDLWGGDLSVWPDAAMGRAACEAALAHPDQGAAEGNVGAGTGATIGKWFGIGRAMRGGLGQASVQVDGHTVAALVAVNACGDVIDPRSGQVVAGARTEDGSTLLDGMAALLRGERPPPPAVGGNTTLGIVATDAALTKAQATKLAQMAHDGLARSINPVHSPGDGDTVFTLATGRGDPVDVATLGMLGALAAEVTARAIVRAVLAARASTMPGLPGLPGWPAARDWPGRRLTPR